ncbi:hypothetical protein [Methylobacterium dankookense]|nr:hypothetical protein [Methylobacterium dankookense]
MGRPIIADLVNLDRAPTPTERERLRAGTAPKGYAALQARDCLE